MISCPDCGQRHYKGEPCPACYHRNLERKFDYARQKAGDCKKCGSKLNYILVCNPYTARLKPECSCYGQPNPSRG
jgi:hypothetical protein